MFPTCLGPAPSPALIRTVVVSYGDGHHDAPRGDALRIDTRSLRNPPSDPAVRERMLHSTGLEPDVRAYVRATPGFEKVVGRGLERALGLLALPDRRFRVDIHVVCGGGRHRSVAVAEELADRLRDAHVGVETEHRHIDRPILSAEAGGLLTDPAWRSRSATCRRAPRSGTRSSTGCSPTSP
ncbi:RapZ C-terminal domain-containing protein [Streptomyces anulatus]|uniref:RapZ C-terminal domain-containing protein n=1 Tax=Streptomyces anulatus TaxID=1892 RepID=UPI0022580566|nr:RNase adapter RapZ [Streptomyces anulatus]MCX4506717.1 hypothetical protein [Streptomyces anulatus]